MEILQFLALCLLCLLIINSGIWIRLNILGRFSAKSTKILMVITSAIFIMGMVYIRM